MSIFNKEREWKFFIEEINSIGNNLLINSDISLNGNLNVNNVLFAFVPRGIICMWSGLEESIPNGWNICDGTNGTPDLRDRFIVGAGNVYQEGEIGGEDSVILKIHHLPSHSHGTGNLTLSQAGNHRHNTVDPTNQGVGYYTTEGAKLGRTDVNSGGRRAICVSDSDNNMYYPQTAQYLDKLITNNIGEHSHQIGGYLQATGNDNPHENRPPYYALFYIMKL